MLSQNHHITSCLSCPSPRNYLPMESEPKVSLEQSSDVPIEEEDVKHSDGDFDDESLSDGDGEFYTNGRLDFTKLFRNSDDDPCEYVFQYDKTGVCVGVTGLFKKNFVAKSVPVVVHDEGTTPIPSPACCINVENTVIEPTQVSSPLLTNDIGK